MWRQWDRGIQYRDIRKNGKIKNETQEIIRATETNCIRERNRKEEQTQRCIRKDKTHW